MNQKWKSHLEDGKFKGEEGGISSYQFNSIQSNSINDQFNSMINDQPLSWRAYWEKEVDTPVN